MILDDSSTERFFAVCLPGTETREGKDWEREFFARRRRGAGWEGAGFGAVIPVVRMGEREITTEHTEYTEKFFGVYPLGIETWKVLI
jgi:hypothetical protein